MRVCLLKMENIITSNELHNAVRNQDVEKVRDLLIANVDVNQPDDTDLGNTPLHIAAKLGNAEIFKLLVDAGADGKTRNITGSTALQCISAKLKKYDLLKLLVDHGAVDVNDYVFENSVSYIPLHLAVIKNDTSMIEYLLSHGADVNLKNKYERTPLHQVAFCNRGDSHFAAAELLLKNGADVRALNATRGTPFHYLISKNYSRGTSHKTKIGIIKLFLKFKPDLNTPDRFDLTPLKSSIYMNEPEIVKLLLDHGSDVNYVDGRGCTPLHSACLKKGTQVIKLLLKNGANIDALDFRSRTPLMLALETWNSTYDLSDGEITETLLFLLKYSNLSDIQAENFMNSMMFNELEPEFLSTITKYFAKMSALGVRELQRFSKIFHDDFFYDFFKRCTDELALAKTTKISDSWITFFTLLADSKRKLKNYAGNEDLINDFKNNECVKKFPIYGEQMQARVTKAIERRQFFDKSAVVLGYHWPILNPTHLIIRDILDCFTSMKDLKKLCE